MTYAYWRVSTNEQNEVRQILAFEACGEKIDRVFGDKLSGKNTDRPEYQKMISYLQPGDLVIIKSIDRLSRKYADIAEEWQRITKEKGADILVLEMRDLLDTRKGKELIGTLISDIVVKLLSYVAETERENIRRRQREGIDAMPLIDGKRVSTKTGNPTGRPVQRCEGFEKMLEMKKSGRITVKDACQQLSISRSQWYALEKKYCG